MSKFTVITHCCVVVLHEHNISWFLIAVHKPVYMQILQHFSNI